MKYNSIEEQERSIKQDEDISLMIRDIYYHTLGQSGDRSKYPCPQIDKVLMGYGINLKEEENE